MVDLLVSKTSAERRVGSSPTKGTKNTNMIKDRQVKLLYLLTPKDYEFTHNKNGYFFKKKNKELKWCMEFEDALDFLRLIRS